MKYQNILLPILLVSCTSVPQREGTLQLSSDRDSKPRVKALVAGQEKTLALDSGTNIPYLNSLSNRQEIISVPTETSSVDIFGQKAMQVKIVKVDYTVGPFEMREVKTQYAPEFTSEALPLKMLMSSQMIFDFEKSAIQLGSNANFCEPKSQFRMKNDMVYVRVKIGESKHWLLWDTGAQASILADKLEKEYRWNPAKEMPLTIASPKSSESGVQTKFFMLQIQIAGLTEELFFITRDISKSVPALNQEADGLLGYNFIRKYRWYFNFNDKTYCLAKNDG